jgi:hypothetical protein
MSSATARAVVGAVLFAGVAGVALHRGAEQHAADEEERAAQAADAALLAELLDREGDPKKQMDVRTDLMLANASRVKVLEDAVRAVGEEAEVVHDSGPASGLRLPFIGIAAGAPNPGVEAALAAALALGEPELCAYALTLKRWACPPGTALSSLSEASARQVVAQLRCEGGLAGEHRAPASLLNAMRQVVRLQQKLEDHRPLLLFSHAELVDTPEERAFFIRLREAGIYCGRWSDAKQERVAGPDGPRVFVSGLQDLQDLYGCPGWLLERLGLTGPAPSDVLVVATFSLSKNRSFSLALDGDMIKTGQDIKFPPKRRRALLHSRPPVGICAASIAGFVGESIARAQCREAAKRLEALLLEAGQGGVSLEHVAAASGDLRVVGRGAHEPGLLSALRA